MAVPKIKIENARGEVLNLSADARYLPILTGTGPPSATINRAKVAVADGTRFNSSTVDERNLLLSIYLLRDIARARLNLYRYIASKQYIKVYYEADGLNVYCEGYVESAEVNPWEKDQRLEVSIVCPMPHWRDVSENYTDASSVTGMFEFPFSIESDGSYSEVSGDVIVLDDSDEAPLRALTIYGKTTQNGTPTPDAPVELESVGDGGSVGVTVCGKNLFDHTAVPSKTSNGITVTNNGDGTFTISGSSESGFYVYKIYTTEESRRLFPAGKYTLSLGSEVKAVPYFLFCFQNAAGRIGEIADDGRSFVLTEEHRNSEGFFVRTGFYSSETATHVAATVKPMVYLSGDNTYGAYKEPQIFAAPTPNGLPGIPVTSGGNYTDANGQQWICDEVDFVRGVYVQRIEKYALQGITQEWMSKSTLQPGTDGYYRYDGSAPNTYGTTGTVCLCSHAPNTEPNPTTGTGAWVATSGILNWRIMLPYETTEEALAFVKAQYENGTPITYAYPINPIETPLSDEDLNAYAALHTNYPNTTVFNDAGAGMYVGYWQNFVPFAGAELSVVDTTASTIIQNNGTVETGLTFVLKATLRSLQPRIYNLSTGEYIGFYVDMLPGDQLEVCTIAGNKRITHIRDGVRTNFLNTIMEGSSWLQLSVGANEYSYTVDEGECELAVYHTNMYIGV